MAIRRTHSTVEATLPWWRCAQPRRSSGGITRSLLIIVASATVATITMPVAAEKPPT